MLKLCFLFKGNLLHSVDSPVTRWSIRYLELFLGILDHVYRIYNTLHYCWCVLRNTPWLSAPCTETVCNNEDMLDGSVSLQGKYCTHLTTGHSRAENNSLFKTVVYLRYLVFGRISLFCDLRWSNKLKVWMSAEGHPSNRGKFVCASKDKDCRTWLRD